MGVVHNAGNEELLPLASALSRVTNSGQASPANPLVSPAPVNWFEALAPRLAQVQKQAPSSVRQEDATSSGSGQPGRALFLNIEEIAERERRAIMQGIPEPPELVALRAAVIQDVADRLAEAEQEAVKIRQAAQEQGYQEGYERGRAQGEQDALYAMTQRADADRAVWVEELTAFIAHVESERKRAWSEMEPLIIQMVFDLAKQVIKREVEDSRMVALAVIQNALRRVTDSTTLRIRVHADDLETVRTHREELMSLVDGVRHVEIVPDRRVEPGGCVVETGAGNIDAQIDTQLDMVGNTLQQMMNYRANQQLTNEE